MLRRAVVLCLVAFLFAGTMVSAVCGQMPEVTYPGLAVAPSSFAFRPTCMDLESEVVVLQRRLAMLEQQYGPTNEMLKQSKEVAASCGSWQASVDYVHWNLHRRGTDFAIVTDASAISVGTGSIQQVDFDYSSGLRAMLGYRTSAGCELQFGYTYYQNDSNASAAAPDGGNLWATRSHPNQNEEAGSAVAAASFDYNVFDCDLRYPLLSDCPLEVNIFSGIRFVDVGQSLEIAYDGADFANANVSSTSRVTGFGLRLGGESVWQATQSFGIVGSFAGSVIYGRFSNRLYETNLDGADVIVDVADRYGQAVTGLEAALALAWRYGRLQIRGGYELTTWFNLADRAMFVDNTHEGAYQPSSTDVLLEGFFVRCGFEY